MSKEKETDTLYNIRHSLAHILAMAVKEFDKDVKLAIGPVIDNGFYYDLDLSKPLSEKELPTIEKKMKALVKKGIEFEGKEVSAKEAREIFKDAPYKLELIDEFEKGGETLTVFTSEDFTDLCAGGHVANTKEINSDGFTLQKIAGAYWRGSEKNKMLTRVYGLAFATKEELDAHLAQLKEAEARDHRKLGKELDLFIFSPLVGSGLPLLTPKGTILRTELDNFVWELRKKRGYERVSIPHITKRELYETSGHWEKFQDELFKVSAREGREYALKPMNCPHHTQIYARKRWSYKELPMRLTETTTVYRDEQSGELGGLSRVLSITQDDAHIFCRANQIKDEMFAIWDIIDEFYDVLKFNMHKIRLSFHDPKHFEKYLGTKEIWQKSEDALRDIAKERKANFYEAEGEAALYGPKIDFMAKDSIGREFQVATIQLDMNLPERFDLTCVNEKGENERIVMIHAAIMGSLERFLGVAIEHFAGSFPLWLSPVQIGVLSISETHNDYARDVWQKLIDEGIRAELRDENESLGKKIRGMKESKVPYFLVLGDKEVSEKTVTLEKRGGGNEKLSVDDLISKLKREIKEKI